MKTSIPRLRRVRFKDGRTFEVLRPKAFDPNALAAKVQQVVLEHCAISAGPYGCAVVIWGSDLAATGRIWNNSTIPGILAPDLVRNVLLGVKIEGWTLDTLNGN